MKIKSLLIKKFRHLENITLEIWDKITVISGPNWTWKSSVLGLIGHMFSYRSWKGWTIWKSSLDNKIFETQFSEVFRFSPDKDYLSEYLWSIENDDGSNKEASSRYIEADKRYRVDVGERQKDEWKIRKPVRYLGLKRLFPLAQESDLNFVKSFWIEDNITEEDRCLYEQWYNKILSSNKRIKPTHTKTRNKESYLPTTDNYDVLWNSSWQDNIAQIILSILSFKNLKQEQWENYNWWLILIDEVDATLYPRAQLQLMDLFLKTAREYNLQFIFTTHSIEILWYLLEENKRTFEYSSKIAFLDDSSGTIIKLDDESSFEKMKAGLMHSVIPTKVVNKLNLYCEDEEAFLFLECILNSDLKKRLTLMKKVSLGKNFYKNLIEAKVPEFIQSIIVLDWDSRNDFRRVKWYKVAFLPWNESPEVVLYNFLSSLEDNDYFWWWIWEYNKRVFLTKSPNTTDRVQMKSWFNDEKKFWWKWWKKLIKRWQESNEWLVKELNENIRSFIM